MMMRYAHRLAAAALPLTVLSMQPASAQLFPGQAVFPCHVVHVTNQVRNPVQVSVSIDPAGRQRLGAGWVDACASADVQLPANLRCGVTLNVRGEVKDTSKVPVAFLKLNPAAAATIADVKGTVTAQNAAEPGNWLALVGVPGKQVGWKPIPAGTKMPPGCPAAPPAAPSVVVFTFTNATTSPVLVTAGGPAVFLNKACIGARQSRTVQVAPSPAYKMVAMPVTDAQCQKPTGSAIVLGAQPVNGRVTVTYLFASSAYALRQLETPATPLPGQPIDKVPDPTADPSVDPSAPPPPVNPMPDPKQDPAVSVPTGK
jgi:hypothetical protein